MFQEVSQLALLHPDLSDPDRVTTELAILQQELAQNLRLVSNLEDVQHNFRDLWQTYQDAKQFFELALETFGSIEKKSHTTLNEMQQQKQVVEQRLNTLITKSETLHQSLTSTGQKNQKNFTDLHNLVQTTTADQKRIFDQNLQSLTTASTTKLNELSYTIQQERNALLQTKEQVQQALTAMRQQSAELTQIYQTLSTTNEKRWQSFEATLLKVKSEVWTTIENTRSDFEKRIETLKQEASDNMRTTKQGDRDIQAELLRLQNNFRSRTCWIGAFAVIALISAMGLTGYLLGPLLSSFFAPLL